VLKNNNAPNGEAGQKIKGVALVPDQHKALSLDYELYETYLENADLTEEQKREFIETLWSIVVSFVDLGFGIHPLQQVLPEGCERNEDNKIPLPPDVINLPKHLSQRQFSKVAAPKSQGRNGGNES
jgi:hypothetical protein